MWAYVLRPIVLGLGLTMLCSGCGEADSQGGDIGYYVASPIGLWEIELWVNGEPAFFESGRLPSVRLGSVEPTSSGDTDLEVELRVFAENVAIPPFFVDGMNQVRIKARRTERSEKEAECQVVVWRGVPGQSKEVLGGVFQDEGELILSEGKVVGKAMVPSKWPGEYTAGFCFDASIEKRGRWLRSDFQGPEDGQDVGGVAVAQLCEADTKAILGVYGEIVAAYKRKDLDKLGVLFVDWEEGKRGGVTSPVGSVAGLVKRARQLMADSAYAVQACSENDIVFQVGRRVVRLGGRDGGTIGGCLLYVGPKGGQTSAAASGCCLRHAELFFFREKGEWRAVLWGW